MRPPFKLYRVSGQSMQPAYQPGDLILALCWFRPQVGQAVIVETGRLIVKRVKKIDHQKFWVEGDNQTASTDSRSFGLVSRFQLLARVVLRLAA